MALNNYNENLYLPESLRIWLKQPNKVSAFRPFDYLRIFDGLELMAILNNRMAADVASGYTQFNQTNLMSGVAPRLLDILVNKVVSKVDYIGYEETEKLSNAISKEYLTLKLKKSFYNSIRTGRDLLVVYPKGDEEEKKVKIRNVDVFRHRLIFDDEKISECFILVDKIAVKVNENYMVFEHRFYDKDDKPKQEYTLQFYRWSNDDLEKTEKNEIGKDEFKQLLLTMEESIAEELKKYKFYNAVELPFEDLGVYHNDASLYNSKYPQLKIPESRFTNIQDKIIEIENSITFKEVDKNIGRGRVVVSSAFDFNKGISLTGNSSNLASRGAFSNPLDNTYFVKYNTNSMQEATPQGFQFDIRSESWRTALNGEIADLCAAFGLSVLDYDPRLLQAGQRTDDEINAMTDITASSVEELRTMNEYQINKMLNTIAKYVGEETPIAIKWNIASIINPSKNQALITQQLSNGTISRKQAIKRSNPDYTDKEVEEELKKIEQERAMSQPLF